MRSRQPRSGDNSATNSSNILLLPSAINHDDDEGTNNKGNSKSFFGQNKGQIIILLSILFSFIFIGAKTNIINNAQHMLPLSSAYSKKHPNGKGKKWTSMNVKPPAKSMAPMGGIIYGAKGKGEDTSRLVKEAIQSGFRHIATGGFHNEYNEAGVGTGWKESGVPRNELYLQTLFLAKSVNGYGTQNCHLEDDLCPPADDLSIEYQVRLSIRSSLHNLQTDYIDAVLVHNFRAALQPYEETLKAWRVLEEYVDKGVIRHLGIVSVHDKDYLTKLRNDAKVKPAIIQNRFHSNRSYDISLRPLFKEWGMADQLFWILTGSAGGKVRKNDVVKAIAEKKGVSSQVLLYSFTMELGGSPLIGSKSVDHMKEDVDALMTNKLEWGKDDLVAMAGEINKNLVQ